MSGATPQVRLAFALRPLRGGNIPYAEFLLRPGGRRRYGQEKVGMPAKHPDQLLWKDIKGLTNDIPTT